jgi:single-strand DNA-binding protein
MNRVLLTGRLTKEIKVENAENGTAYTRFSIAVDKWSKEKEKKTIFVDCVAFGHSANFLGKYAVKGNKIIVDGELDNKIKEYDDGRKVTYWTVIANSVELAEAKQNNVVAEEPAEEIEEPAEEIEEPYEL